MASRLDQTASSSLESVMADYNKTMLERYNLFVLDYGKEAENQKEALARWKTYFQKEADETMGNLLYQVLFDSEWFSIKGMSYNVERTWSLLDKEGALFANQIAQYMKYKEIGNLVSTLLEQIKVIQKGVEGQDVLNTLWKKEKQQPMVEANQIVFLPNEVTNVLLTVELNASRERISELDLPSRLQGITTGEPENSPMWNDISEEVLIGEYILEQFSSYIDMEQEKNQEKIVCQQEYILFGKLSDKENMNAMADLLLAVRCGLNLISLLSSETMQAAVETASVTISSGLLNPELAPLFQIVLNCIWTYTESEHDVETLLKGETVPFLKEESQWVEHILDFEQKDETESQLESIESGSTDSSQADAVIGELKEIGTTKKPFYSMEMGYEDYIRIFLLFLKPETKYYRMMDVIQIQMQNKYPNFKIVNCICGIEATVTVKGKAKFFMFIPWNIQKKYELTRTVSFLY